MKGQRHIILRLSPIVDFEGMDDVHTRLTEQRMPPEVIANINRVLQDVAIKLLIAGSNTSTWINTPVEIELNYKGSPHERGELIAKITLGESDTNDIDTPTD